MDFSHSDDRRMLADTIARFVREQYSFETRCEIVASEDGFSRQKWAQFAELGLIGALFGEESGGFGGDGFDIAVVFEELGKGLVVEPFLATLLAGRCLAEAGAETHRAVLEAMIAGDKLVGFAHGEPQSRYGLAEVELEARPEGGNHVLNGVKSVVLHGGAADGLVVSARTSGASPEPDGISLFLVEADAEGMSRRAYPTIDGAAGAEIRFDNVVVPPAALVGKLDRAYPVIERAAAFGLLALAAEALGAVETAKSMTLDYLHTRKQFGRPIGAFQALQHRMADMLIEIEQLRSAVINAAGAADADRPKREKSVAAAKYLAGKIGRLIAEESIQMHGGIGMTWEYALPHYCKRLVMIDHILGDEDHHLARYIEIGREAVQ